MRLAIALVFTLLFSFQLRAQLNLIQSPKEKAFIPQDRSKRLARINLIGEVTQSTFNRLNIKIYRDQVLIQNHTQNLNFASGKAPFSKWITLKTGKFQYTIRYELSGSTTYRQDIKEILVGDVFIIQGQSNAVAANYNPFNTSYYSPYLRSYGSSHFSPNAVESDSLWHDIDAIKVYSSGSVGQWGAVMARHLLDSFNTPICLLNGAVGGTRIELHQPIPNNLESLYTIYGRLLYRARKAKLDSNITGILYFQGESDGSLAVKHDTGFTNLYHHWQRDYPNFQKLYVVQVRDGCGRPSLQLREVQRQFEFKLKNCQTVSANGLDNHDNCHYGFVNGYEKLGTQLSKLLARDFYWPIEVHNINPPNIKYAFYTDGLQREIRLVMQNPNDIVEVDNGFENLFEIEGDNSVQITSGKLENNEITLKLNKSSCAITGLSYNGKMGRNHPWVKGKSEMGLISFYNIPIKNHNIATNQLACLKSYTTIGTQVSKGVKYTIERLSNGKKVDQPFMRLQLAQKDSFLLCLTFDSLSCPLKDSIIIYVDVDHVTPPELGKDTTLCYSDTLHFSPVSTNFRYFKWHQNGSVHQQFDWSTNQAGTLYLEAESFKGCNYRDEKNISIRTPYMSLDTQYFICSNDSIEVRLADSFEHYFWDELKGNSRFMASDQRKYRIRVIDSLGCEIDSQFTVSYFTNSLYPDWDSTICPNMTVSITKPKNATRWYRKGIQLSSTLFYIHGSKKIPITLVDSNNCQFHDVIDIDTFATVDYPEFIDTSLCDKDTLHIRLPDGMQRYSYDNQELQNGDITEFRAGSFPYTFDDLNLCQTEGLLKINLMPLPHLDFVSDTSICKDDSLVYILPEMVDFALNNFPVVKKITLKPDLNYLISATNEAKCSTEKWVHIKSIICTSTLKTFADQTVFNIYPNPSRGTIEIESLIKAPSSICIFNQQGKKVWQNEKTPEKIEAIDLSELSNGIYLIQVDNLNYTLLKID